ncbi:FAR1 DNA-binding domain [Sesbania bispinosa]|nr:FAR1 DNA-binding domain [Sesbania bispinosa]
MALVIMLADWGEGYGGLTKLCTTGGFFVAILGQDEDGGVFVFGDNCGEKEVVDDEGTGDNSFHNDNGGGFFFGDENGGGVFFVGPDWEDSNEDGYGDEGCGEIIAISCEDDILNMGDLSLFSLVQIVKYEFASIDVGYKFYMKYAEANGFGIRKGRGLRKRRTLEKYQKEFMCCREGFREDRGLKMEERVREPRPETRRMSESDVVQMNNMMKVGIRPPNIFSTFASQAGGYEKIGFRKKDMYNKINEQRRKLCSDAKGAIEFLGELRLMDRMMYYEHTVDAQEQPRGVRSSNEFKCGSLRMESRGLPCEHIIAVLSHLVIEELPEMLVLKRWCKGAKDGLDEDGNYAWNVGRTARRNALCDFYFHISDFKAVTIEKYNVEREKLLAEWRQCKAEAGSEEAVGGAACNVGNDSLRDPVRAATKGSGGVSSSAGIRVRRKQNGSVLAFPLRYMHTVADGVCFELLETVFMRKVVCLKENNMH